MWSKKDKKTQDGFFESAKEVARVAFGSKGWPVDWIDKCEGIAELTFVSKKLMDAIQKHPNVSAIKIEKEDGGWACHMASEKVQTDFADIPQAGKLKDFDTLMKTSKNGKN